MVLYICRTCSSKVQCISGVLTCSFCGIRTNEDLEVLATDSHELVVPASNMFSWLQQIPLECFRRQGELPTDIYFQQLQCSQTQISNNSSDNSSSETPCRTPECGNSIQFYSLWRQQQRNPNQSQIQIQSQSQSQSQKSNRDPKNVLCLRNFGRAHNSLLGPNLPPLQPKSISAPSQQNEKPATFEIFECLSPASTVISQNQQIMDEAPPVKKPRSIRPRTLSLDANNTTSSVDSPNLTSALEEKLKERVVKIKIKPRVSLPNIHDHNPNHNDASRTHFGNLHTKPRLIAPAQKLPRFSIFKDLRFCQPGKNPTEDQVQGVWDQIQEQDPHFFPSAVTTTDFDDICIVLISAKQREDKVRCPICCVVFKLDENVYRLRCTHIYHSECILTYMKRGKHCPACRMGRFLIPATSCGGGGGGGGSRRGSACNRSRCMVAGNEARKIKRLEGAARVTVIARAAAESKDSHDKSR